MLGWLETKVKEKNASKLATKLLLGW